MHKSSTLLALSLVSTLASAQAGAPPNSADIQREVLKSIAATSAAPSAAPVTRSLPHQDAAGDGPSVRVTRIVLEGVSLVNVTDLERMISPQLDRDLSLRELRSLAAQVAAFYEERGFFARVTLPAQDITDGVVRISVAEARVGRLKVESRPGAVLDPVHVERFVSSRLRSGEPLSLKAFERALLLANDIPGADVVGSLSQGTEHGETDLLIESRASKRIAGYAGASNSGSRATGVAQVTASAVLNSIAGAGEQLVVVGAKTEGMTFGRVEVSRPIGYDGLRASLFGSQMRYRLLGAFSELDARGRTSIWGGDARYALLRSPNMNLTVHAGLERSHYSDYTLGIRLHEKVLKVGTLGVTGDANDDVGGGSRTVISLQASAVHLDLSRSPLDELIDSFGPSAQGLGIKVILDATRIQNVPTQLNRSLYARLNLTLQAADSNLDSSQKMSLGGPTGVRGYPPGEAPGDMGARMAVELHTRFGQGDAFAFIDAGYVVQHAKPWDRWNAATGAPNSYGLSAAGIGVFYPLTDRLTLSATVAKPLASNPLAIAGRNEDGSKRGVRGYLSISAAL